MIFERDRLEAGRKRYSLQNATVFREEDHPRADDGKFGTGGGEATDGGEKDSFSENIDKKISDLKDFLEKTDPSKNKSRGKYQDQKTSNLVEDSKKWMQKKEELDNLERVKEMYPKAKKSIETMEKMLEKGEKPDGTKFTKDEKVWLKQQISSKQKLVSRIEAEHKKSNSSPIRVYRAPR